MSRWTAQTLVFLALGSAGCPSGSPRASGPTSPPQPSSNVAPAAATVAGATPAEALATPAEGGVAAAEAPPATAQPVKPRDSSGLDTAFEALRSRYEDLTYTGLIAQLGLRRASSSAPSLDPTRVAFYERARASLQLTPEEESIYRRTGVVGVDHSQRYSMGSAYYAIYTRDLPVLVTTDSILHAMHRSFDSLLSGLESDVFAPRIEQALRGAHDVLGAEVRGAADPALTTSLRDVDLYLTVARNLLAGSGAPDARPWSSLPACGPGSRADGGCQTRPDQEIWDGSLQVHSVTGQDDTVARVLEKVARAQPDLDFAIYGGRRQVDWSQFLPRGHYASNPALRRYFRGMMWLGRVDLGFSVGQPAPSTGINQDDARELRDALVLSTLLSRSNQLVPLASVNRAIDFMIGAADGAGPADVVAALASAGARTSTDLVNAATLGKVRDALKGVSQQQIRSQTVFSPPDGIHEAPLPDVFQLFGQRFALDSFVLSKVVFDSIVFGGKKQERFMPAGLDAMAALGSSEATYLLRPQLEQYNYSANLLAARTLVEQRLHRSGPSTLYEMWLGALETIDDVPAKGLFPETMRGRAWQDKQLQTQLASWAELRHDTVLYVKQSYTAYNSCEYPTGYVEPYPEFFARIAAFAEETERRLDPAWMSPYLKGFLDGFSETAHKLERLAKKELAGQPFDADEKKFIKSTIDIRGGGSGPPRYDGWYPRLIYGDGPALWHPTIADVHTDPNPDGEVLEAAVGDVGFVVVAVDNAGDRAAYVGPIYSYYEFTDPNRLTDEMWQTRLQSGPRPARPEWVRTFQGTAVQRTIGRGR